MNKIGSRGTTSRMNKYIGLILFFKVRSFYIFSVIYEIPKEQQLSGHFFRQINSYIISIHISLLKLPLLCFRWDNLFMVVVNNYCCSASAVGSGCLRFLRFA